MKDDNFAHVGSNYFVVPPYDRSQMQIANRTAGKAAKLQMHEVHIIRNAHLATVDRHQFMNWNKCTRGHSARESNIAHSLFPAAGRLKRRD